MHTQILFLFLGLGAWDPSGGGGAFMTESEREMPFSFTVSISSYRDYFYYTAVMCSNRLCLQSNMFYRLEKSPWLLLLARLLAVTCKRYFSLYFLSVIEHLHTHTSYYAQNLSHKLGAQPRRGSPPS